jgi:hypothetical protein
MEKNNPPSTLPTRKNSSLILIRINLTRHDHHPHQEHRPNNPKRKLGLPVLTYILLLQPRQRIRIRALVPAVEHVRVTLVVDVRAREKLDRGPDDAGDEEHE